MLKNRNKRKIVVLQTLTLSALIITICLLRLNAQSEINRRDNTNHSGKNLDSIKVESNKKLGLIKQLSLTKKEG